MEQRIDVEQIWKHMGCDNCRNSFNVPGTGPCEDCSLGCEKCSIPPDCNNCRAIPSHYVPKRNSIFEKAFYCEEDTITQIEYNKFLENPYSAI